MGLAVWCEDEAGPFQAIPHPGSHWQPEGRPTTQPHEYVREGTIKVLTLFHPATGQVRVRPVASTTNAILHRWLRETLEEIMAALPAAEIPGDPTVTRALWQAWQDGLSVRFTLPEQLPPLRVLLVWDNLAGHKTPEMIVWLCQHGIMPLYTPLGASWLNMAEAIQRILKRRALAGQHPQKPRADRRVVRTDGTRLEPTAHTLYMERQAPAAAETTGRRRATSTGQFRCSHALSRCHISNTLGGGPW